MPSGSTRIRGRRAQATECEHIVVEGTCSACHLRGIEQTRDASRCASSEVGAFVRVRGKASQGSRNGAVVGRHAYPRVADRLEVLGQVGDYRGEPVSHGLQKRESEPFPTRGENVEVGCCEKARHVAPLAEGPYSLAGGSFYLRPQGSVPDDQQGDLGPLRGVNGSQRTLVLVQRADPDPHDLRLGDTELLARLAALDLAGMSWEANAVSNDDSPAGYTASDCADQVVVLALGHADRAIRRTKNGSQVECCRHSAGSRDATHEIEPVQRDDRRASPQERQTECGHDLAVSIDPLGDAEHVPACHERRVGLVQMRLVDHFALGAARGQVLRLVLAQGGRLAFAGIALGTLASLGAGRVLASLLYGVSPYDPVAYSVAAGLLVLVAGLANLAPALTAARIDPLGALRRD